MSEIQTRPERTGSPSAAATVRRRIESGGERFWRMVDFPSLPPAAVIQTLSRMAREGALERAGRGVYYRPRPTAFGPSRPSEGALRRLHQGHCPLAPADLSAANLLGFTTQNPAAPSFATPAGSVPRALIGRGARLHTRRPESWGRLSPSDGALLDFLRSRGRFSEMAPEETKDRLLGHFREEGRFERLAGIALTEPPRVRAMLGAIGQEIGADRRLQDALRESLNPLSRFDFGALRVLRHAREWQAK